MANDPASVEPGDPLPKEFRCYLVNRDVEGRVTGQITTRRTEELPPGEVLVRVVYSSLNYKDALAATGHTGVNKVFPHIPGVDAAGYVVKTGVYEFLEGDPVLVTGFDMGANRWGGYAEYVRVPADWVVPLPHGLTLRETMILGTAGLTAAMGVDALQKHDVLPGAGPVVVTGASGGVGSVAVAVLAKLGYDVTAVSGKPQARELLEKLGARQIVDRAEVDDTSGKPLLSGRWAGGVDTVGGNTLSTLLRATRHGGCVAACGLARSAELPITVYPFILRGITLAGLDAAWMPIPLRHQLWDRLAHEWRVDQLESLARFVPLETIPQAVDDLFAGRIVGRVVVEVGGQGG